MKAVTKYLPGERVRITKDLKRLADIGILGSCAAEAAGRVFTVDVTEIIEGEFWCKMLETTLDVSFDNSVIDGIVLDRYEPGDIVRIREDMVHGEIYGSWPYIDSMSNILGKELTVKEYHGIHNAYEFIEMPPGETGHVTDEMIWCKVGSNSTKEEKKDMKPEAKYQIGDYVVMIPDIEPFKVYTSKMGLPPLPAPDVKFLSNHVVRITDIIGGFFKITDHQDESWIVNDGMIAGLVKDLVAEGTRIIVTNDMDKLNCAGIGFSNACKIAGKEFKVVKIDVYDAGCSYMIDSEPVHWWLSARTIGFVIPEEKPKTTYNVGDKVIIVDKRTETMNHSGYMDKWLGKVMTIKAIGNGGWTYTMEEDNGAWTWDCDMIAGLDTEKQDVTPKTKYKVGEYVVVRHDLKLGVRYGMKDNPYADGVALEMLKHAGSVVKIVALEEDCLYNGHCYKIEGSTWRWTDEMFSGYPHEVIKPGMKIRITEDVVSLAKIGLGWISDMIAGKYVAFGHLSDHRGVKCYHFKLGSGDWFVHEEHITKVKLPSEKKTEKKKTADVLNDVVAENKSVKKEEKSERFKPIDTIVILSDGNTTKAYRKQEGRITEEVEIHRYYADEHDMHIAAVECVDRMSAPSSAHFYSGKIKCVKSFCSWWEEGKTYTMNNGRVVAEDGDVYSGYKTFHKFTEDANLAIWREVE